MIFYCFKMGAFVSYLQALGGILSLPWILRERLRIAEERQEQLESELVITSERLKVVTEKYLKLSELFSNMLDQATELSASDAELSPDDEG